MSGNSIFGKSVLNAFAAALVTTAIPATAFAQDERREERGGREWGSGARPRDGSQRGEMQRGGGDFRSRWTAQGQAQPPQAQPQQPRPPQIQTVPQQARPAWSTSTPREQSANPGWPGRGNVEATPRWSRQGRTDEARRSPTDRTVPPSPGWDGTRWNPTNPSQARAGIDGRAGDRDRDAGRDRDRDRNWSTRDQNPAWTGRNPTYSDGNRNREYRRDDNRNSWSTRDGWNNRNGWNNRGRDNDRRWNNNWRQDRRYDWNGYRSAHRNLYRLPRYYAPYRGYNYSRLSIGIFLNSGFYGNSYWINDPWSYRLPPAYAGCRWVRYYNDVVLVDTYTGEVVDVIYNFFW